MAQRCISNESLCTTGFHYTLSLISGKYKMTILYTLMEFGVVRFNEMKRYIGGISYKTLSATLKELEADQLVHREEYPQIPPKVEYSLTERGKSLIPILDNLCQLGGRPPPLIPRFQGGFSNICLTSSPGYGTIPPTRELAVGRAAP